jgi:hypothetical protein
LWIFIQIRWIRKVFLIRAAELFWDVKRMVDWSFLEPIVHHLSLDWEHFKKLGDAADGAAEGAKEGNFPLDQGEELARHGIPLANDVEHAAAAAKYVSHMYNKFQMKANRSKIYTANLSNENGSEAGLLSGFKRKFFIIVILAVLSIFYHLYITHTASLLGVIEIPWNPVLIKNSNGDSSAYSIKVDYSGSWSGVVTTGSVSKKASGHGVKIVPIEFKS